jgi:hypothetical protein
MAEPLQQPLPLGSCAFAVIHESLTNPSDILAYYDRLRDYIQHEDDLINSRLTWSLTVHGFLFAIYGIILGKVADIFVELNKTVPPSAMLEHVISGLFFFQIPVAAFGAVVGRQSRKAIVAAHNAIQHLFTISHSGGLLMIPPWQTTLQDAIPSGSQNATPTTMVNILVGARILVDPDSKDNEEIVTVTAVAGTTFVANFKHVHGKGALITPLGSALLPKVISGGDKGLHTAGAGSYYLRLPKLVGDVWIGLSFISVALFIASLFRCWFFPLLAK